jgi:hypothetical protein
LLIHAVREQQLNEINSEEYGLMRHDAVYLVNTCLRAWRDITEDSNIQSVSGGIINILGGGSMDYSQ